MMMSVFGILTLILTTTFVNGVAISSNSSTSTGSPSTGSPINSTSGTTFVYTTASPLPTGTTGHVSPPVSNFTDACGSLTDCSSCTSSTSCVWCKDGLECVSGTVIGPSGAYGTCGWQWEQCSISGVAAIAIPAAGIFALLLLAVIICCCCCCRRRKRARLRRSTREPDPEPETATAKPAHPRTDAARKALMEKYGIRPRQLESPTDDDFGKSTERTPLMSETRNNKPRFEPLPAHWLESPPRDAAPLKQLNSPRPPERQVVARHVPEPLPFDVTDRAPAFETPNPFDVPAPVPYSAQPPYPAVGNVHAPPAKASNAPKPYGPARGVTPQPLKPGPAGPARGASSRDPMPEPTTPEPARRPTRTPASASAAPPPAFPSLDDFPTSLPPLAAPASDFGVQPMAPSAPAYQPDLRPPFDPPPPPSARPRYADLPRLSDPPRSTSDLRRSASDAGRSSDLAKSDSWRSTASPGLYGALVPVLPPTYVASPTPVRPASHVPIAAPIADPTNPFDEPTNPFAEPPVASASRADSTNPFDELPDRASVRSGVAPRPQSAATPAPAPVASLNPFDEPSDASNPFAASPPRREWQAPAAGRQVAQSSAVPSSRLDYPDEANPFGPPVPAAAVVPPANPTDSSRGSGRPVESLNPFDYPTETNPFADPSPVVDTNPFADPPRSSAASSTAMTPGAARASASAPARPPETTTNSFAQRPQAPPPKVTSTNPFDEPTNPFALSAQPPRAAPPAYVETNPFAASPPPPGPAAPWAAAAHTTTSAPNPPRPSAATVSLGASRGGRPKLLTSATDVGDAPESILCPITSEVMREPVMLTSCGHTFERRAIEHWLSKSPAPRCPSCSQPADVRQLQVNFFAKGLIDDWLAKRKS
eukprot:TRINITY_DN6161_c0_g2_i1.p1 TRINITY_DN6161_c0_g2~~TRINITY_DN6161_c0_g2_i1.p1  ORF type:complete len:879 (-),score=199.74 TRINITY_DN6161_c0_g2_i1:105-2741(-)